MKEYQPIACDFYDVIEAAAVRKAYCKIQFYTEIGELMNENAVLKNIFTENKAEFLELATGELIRLDRIVSIDQVYAPQYADYKTFSCDC